jgi:hypothetical protein
MQHLQQVKASAPWKIQKEASKDHIVTREQLLTLRMTSIHNEQPTLGSAGLRSMSSKKVADILSASAQASIALKELPAALAPPPGLVHPSDKKQEFSTQVDNNEGSMPSNEKAEYKVLLQNLPKNLMKETVLRSMIKQAELKDVKKLAFRSDGRALITVTTHAALCQCITHFNGLPWFNAPSCTVPVVTATQVVSAAKPASEVRTSSVAALSAEAPTFVPGAVHWTAPTSSLSKASDKLHEVDSLSEKSTDDGLSDDEALSGSDLEPEAQMLAAH